MEPLTIFILIIAVSIAFYVQTIAGFAGNLVAIPILLLVLSFQESIALMSIFLLLFSTITIYKYWRQIDKKIVLELGIGSAIGLILGVYLLKFGNPLLVKKGFGIFILAYIINRYIKKKKVKAFEKLGLLFGFVGGIISGLYNSGGPALITYITNKLDRGAIIRATLIGSLGIVNFIRVPALIVSGILTADIFFKSVIVLPFFFLSIYLGHKSYKKIPEKRLEHFIIALLAISAIFIIIE